MRHKKKYVILFATLRMSYQSQIGMDGFFKSAPICHFSGNIKILIKKNIVFLSYLDLNIYLNIYTKKFF